MAGLLVKCSEAKAAALKYERTHYNVRPHTAEATVSTTFDTQPRQELRDKENEHSGTLEGVRGSIPG